METNFKTIKNLSLLVILIFSMAIQAQEKGVAKVIIIKGKVIAEFKKSAQPLKKGDWIKEGTQIKTGSRSFAKLYFVDKSSMNIGPKSEVVINQFPKKAAGIITLKKGQLRSKVSKDYMKIKNKDQSKLFIKTKTAAMGVRGTEFIVGYNFVTQETTLDVLEGAVAMNKLDSLAANAPKIDHKVLERVVSNKAAVMVRGGFKTDVNKIMLKPREPLKLQQEEMNKLEKSDDSFKEEGAGMDSTGAIPPGVDSSQFINDASELDKEMTEVVGEVTMENIDTVVNQEMEKIEDQRDPASTNTELSSSTSTSTSTDPRLSGDTSTGTDGDSDSKEVFKDMMMGDKMDEMTDAGTQFENDVRDGDPTAIGTAPTAPVSDNKTNVKIIINNAP